MFDSRELKDKCAIVGIGETDFTRNSGRSELTLSCEAVKKAIDDAGIHPSVVDGILRYEQDSSREVFVARSLGLNRIRFWGSFAYGGSGGCSCIMHAMMAIVTGMASCVVCYRGVNGRSGSRFGTSTAGGFTGTAVVCEGRSQWTAPFGLVTATQQAAVQAQRYLFHYGGTTSSFGAVAVACRKHACLNPKAMMYGKTMTLEDHQASRMIAEPLRLLDCCLESDGAVAVVVTSAERARDLKQTPAVIAGAAQGMDPLNESMANFTRDMTSFPDSQYVAEQLFGMAGVKPGDIDVAEVYDAYTFLIPLFFEDYGFCKRGEGGAFVEGGRIELGRSIPVNTHGGNLSEAYVHGMTHIAEGVRQLRGTSTGQVKNAELVLVTGAPVAPTSAIILRK